MSPKKLRPYRVETSGSMYTLLRFAGYELPVSEAGCNPFSFAAFPQARGRIVMSFSATQRCMLAAACLLGSWWPSESAYAQVIGQERGAVYINFQVPGILDTYPLSINSSSMVTGFCAQATHSYHGFLRDAQGRITLVDPPGSTQSYGRSINEAGDIAGYYGDSNGGVHSFLRSRSGGFTSFDFQGNETVAWSINDLDAITGYYVSGNIQHGFVRSPRGEITSFDPPGSVSTFAHSINDFGVITGSYTEANGLQHGFVRDPQGTITTFDPAGSVQTEARAINVARAITGYYTDAKGLIHGFVRDPRGTVTPFDPAGSVQTIARAINALGAITGDYSDAKGAHHGFLRSPDGGITSFDPPGSDQVLNEEGINNFGVVTGSFSHVNGEPVFGFLRVPGPLQPGTYAVTDSLGFFVDGGFYLYGDPIVRLWVFVSGNPSQYWKFAAVPGGFTMLNQGTGQYASDIGGELVEGPHADVWTVTPVSGGFTLRNNRTGLFLTDPGVKTGALTLTTKGSTWQMSSPQ